jgi:hypothetical protein
MPQCQCLICRITISNLVENKHPVQVPRRWSSQFTGSLRLRLLLPAIWRTITAAMFTSNTLRLTEPPAECAHQPDSEAEHWQGPEPDSDSDSESESESVCTASRLQS